MGQGSNTYASQITTQATSLVAHQIDAQKNLEVLALILSGSVEADGILAWQNGRADTPALGCTVRCPASRLMQIYGSV